MRTTSQTKDAEVFDKEVRREAAAEHKEDIARMRPLNEAEKEQASRQNEYQVKRRVSLKHKVRTASSDSHPKKLDDDAVSARAFQRQVHAEEQQVTQITTHDSEVDDEWPDNKLNEQTSGVGDAKRQQRNFPPLPQVLNSLTGTQTLNSLETAASSVLPTTKFDDIFVDKKKMPTLWMKKNLKEPKWLRDLKAKKAHQAHFPENAKSAEDALSAKQTPTSQPSDPWTPLK
jgi:hypothetical protein